MVAIKKRQHLQTRGHSRKTGYHYLALARKGWDQPVDASGLALALEGGKGVVGWRGGVWVAVGGGGDGEEAVE